MDRDLWVFGYGSLMWNPEFPFVSRHVATLDGFARTFCMASIHHRGTPDAPGLVLALDATHGASCTGVVFRVAETDAERVLAEVRDRELISSAYVERRLPVRLADGGERTALCYVIEKDHPQYQGDLTLERQAAIIASAAGGRGPNDEYLFNTVRHLTDLGIDDPDLSWLASRVRRLAAA